MIDTVFVIKAHNFPELAGRLAARLQADWAATLVHVDGKVDARPFAAATADIANCTMVEDAERIPVFWGGFSIAEVTLRMGTLVLARYPGVRRIFILSGVDYPLMAVEDMHELLNGDEEFVRANNRLDPKGFSPNDTFIKRRYFGNNRWLNERDSPLPRLAKAAALIGRRIRPRLPDDLTVYHGSDWYGLTAQGMRTVIDFYRDRPDVVRAFRQVRSPTEMIVQTALRASPLSDRIADARTPDGSTSPFQSRVYGSHYVDWSAGGSHPKTLGIEDLDAMSTTGAFFARKMHPERSATLLDALDLRAAR